MTQVNNITVKYIFDYYVLFQLSVIGKPLLSLRFLVPLLVCYYCNLLYSKTLDCYVILNV